MKNKTKNRCRRSDVRNQRSEIGIIKTVGAVLLARPTEHKIKVRRRGTGHRAQKRINYAYNSGITLIALIITIIVLIILAGVTLSVTLGENGILNKSKQAVDKYQESAQKEQEELDKINDNLESLDPNSLASNVKIGDYVNYIPKSGETVTIPQGSYNGKTAGTFEDVATINENGETTAEGEFGSGYSEDQTFTVPDDTSNIKWRVLSIEDGCVNLISEKEIGRNGQWTGVSDDALYLQDITGYAYGVQVINKVCSIYGTGDGAKNARSINVEDVNKISGYDVMNDSNYKETYGIEKSNWGNNWIETYYWYTYNKSGLDLRTAKKDSLEYKLVFESDLSTNNYSYYWLASRCVEVVSDGEVYFRLRNVNDGSVGIDGLYYCYSVSADYHGNKWPIRPVVSLKSTVKKTSDRNWNSR